MFHKDEIDDAIRRVLDKGTYKISMDSRGQVCNNIFIEGLWGTVKYVEVYLYDYHTVSEGCCRLPTCFQFYNMESIHENLGYRTPMTFISLNRLTLNTCRLARPCTSNIPVYCLGNMERLDYLTEDKFL